MRVFGRILYAIFAVGLFLLAFTYSKDMILNKYLEDVFATSLTDENSEYPKYYYFYSSIPDYYKSDPIISVQENGYEIMGYEVLTYDIDNDNNLNLNEYVYIIVYSDTEDLSQVDHIYLENSSTEDQVDINLQRFKLLNILNGVNDIGTVYLDKDLFLSGNYDSINLTNHEGDILVNSNFALSENDFTIHNFIEKFYADNGKVPAISDFENMSGNNIFPYIHRIATGYAYIFYIGMGIYFTVIIVLTYLIFFRKRKRNY